MRSTKQKVKVGRAVFPRLPKHAARRAATASGGQGRVTRARTAAWRRFKPTVPGELANRAAKDQAP